ncbi:hypothetical protein EK21DRAFT_106041 [Setomelanomma holmii]|uniref:HORMA domain-containing protein n=1 Tax=Setomelanomma holmii TaxID=210430 RepID=A0A9P4HNG5_9PLEO|nr:hypothetical protein EK21DRAFT_106041 [Setomelanomma holmii]
MPRKVITTQCTTSKSSLPTEQLRPTIHVQTLTTPTTTSQEQTLQQSTQMTYGTFLASVSALASARYLFRADCFAVRTYKLDGSVDRNAQPGPGMATAPASLAFNSSYETGVKDSLEKAYLGVLKFVICQSEEHSHIIVEEWTFEVDYLTIPSTGARSVKSIEVTKKRQPNVKTTIEEAKLSASRFIQRVTTFSNCHTELPDSRHLRVEFTPTPETPSDYVPLGFYRRTAVNAQFQVREGFVQDTASVPPLTTAHHSIDEANGGDLPNTLRLPEQPSVVKAGRLPLRGKEFVLSSSSEDGPPKPIKAAILKKSKPTPSVAANGAGRSSAQALHTKHTLQQMLRPENDTTDLEETQRADDTVLDLLQPVIKATSPNVVFRSSKVNDLEATSDEDSSSRLTHHVFTNIDEVIASEVKVACACGYRDEEGPMTTCAFYQSHQHLNCYAYQSRMTARFQVSRFATLAYSARRRKCRKPSKIWPYAGAPVIFSRTPPLMGENFLPKHSAGQKNPPRAIIEELRSLGFLAPFSRKPFTSDKFIWIQSEAIITRVIEALLEPTVCIEQFLQRPTLPDSKTTKTNAQSKKRSADAQADVQTPQAKRQSFGFQCDLEARLTPSLPGKL